jgi:outer membrane protein assembly factor BamD (BamD/ComL family)
MTSGNGHIPSIAAGLGQAAPVNPVEQKFRAAAQQYKVKNYITAIILFERVRNMPAASAEVKRDCLYNIGMANLRLKRPATAVLYFERYLASSGLSEADRRGAEERLNEAKRRTGIPV